MNKSLVQQAFEATANLLGEIPVPVSMYEQIAKPIQVAINNLVIGLNALNEPDEEKTVETEETEDGNADAG